MVQTRVGRRGVELKGTRLAPRDGYKSSAVREWAILGATFRPMTLCLSIRLFCIKPSSELLLRHQSSGQSIHSYLYKESRRLTSTEWHWIKTANYPFMASINKAADSETLYSFMHRHKSKGKLKNKTTCYWQLKKKNIVTSLSLRKRNAYIRQSNHNWTKLTFFSLTGAFERRPWHNKKACITTDCNTEVTYDWKNLPRRIWTFWPLSNFRTPVLNCSVLNRKAPRIISIGWRCIAGGNGAQITNSKLSGKFTRAY